MSSWLGNVSPLLLPSIPYEDKKILSQATDAELLELNRLLRSEHPYGGCCVLGTEMLAARYRGCRKVPLEYGEFTCPSGETIHHSWAEEIDGTVVDITADQFKIPGFGPVARIPIGDARHKWYRWWRER